MPEYSLASGEFGIALAAWDGALDEIDAASRIGESGGFGAREPAYPLGPRFTGPRQGLARGGSAPLRSPVARAPAEFAGGGRGRKAPRPSCRRVLMAERRTVTGSARTRRLAGRGSWLVAVGSRLDSQNEGTASIITTPTVPT